MEETIYNGLQEMSHSIKEVEKFRASHRIRVDTRARQLHSQMVEKLKSIEVAIEQSMMGLA